MCVCVCVLLHGLLYFFSRKSLNPMLTPPPPPHPTPFSLLLSPPPPLSLTARQKTRSYNPNMAPPGGMIGFHLLQGDTKEGDVDGAWYVKVHFQTQSMSQMRTAQVLNSSNPPDCAPAVMPTCNSGPDLSCPVAQFKAIVLAAIRSECLV